MVREGSLVINALTENNKLSLDLATSLTKYSTSLSNDSSGTTSVSDGSTASNTSTETESSSSSISYDKVDEAAPINTSCGISTFRPDRLQKCAHPKAYLIIISLCVIVQGFAVSGINNVNTASYERRYSLSSKQAGLITSVFEITAGLTVGFVGYFDSRAHQPRILALATLSLALGCLTMVVAHMTSPPYQPREKIGSQFRDNLCTLSSNSTAVPESNGHDEVNLNNFLYILMLGQSLNGFAGTCFYSIGITFLDESVSSDNSPLYQGIMMSMAVFGPAIGFIAGGTFLSVYVDAPFYEPPDGITPDDPRWVGAWWLGFLISGLLAAVLVPLLFCFPRELPGTRRIRAEKVSEAHADCAEQKLNSLDFSFSWKNLPLVFWYLLKNPAYILGKIKMTVLWCLCSGFITFAAKFVQTQFKTGPSWSAMLVGIIAVPSSAFGQFLGGFICKKMKLKVPGMYKFLLFCALVTVLTTPVFWARCEDRAFFGFSSFRADDGNSSVNIEKRGQGLQSECNIGCGCNSVEYEPVCFNNVQYFSPCHAGCTRSQKKQLDLNDPISKDYNKEYSDCSCVDNSLFNEPSSDVDSRVTAGLCHGSCSILYYAVVPCIIVLMFALFLQSTPFTTVTLRVVPENQRSSAMALQWIMMRFLGSLPGPILFGTMMDSTCLIWQPGQSGDERGSCWVYDNADLSKKIFLLVSSLMFGNFLFTLLAMLFYKPPPQTRGVAVGNYIDTLDELSSKGSSASIITKV